MSDSGGQVARAYLDAFQRGDVEAALSCLAPNSVIVEPDGLPFSGRFVGRDGFMELLGKLTTVFDAVVEGVDVHEAESIVVGQISLTLTSKSSGKSLPVKAVELYTVVDGHIAVADVYYKEAAGIAALAAG